MRIGVRGLQGRESSGLRRRTRARRDLQNGLSAIWQRFFDLTLHLAAPTLHRPPPRSTMPSALDNEFLTGRTGHDQVKSGLKVAKSGIPGSNCGRILAAWAGSIEGLFPPCIQLP